MANISVVGRIVSDDIELKIIGLILRSVPVRELTQERSIIRSLLLALSPLNLQKENCIVVR